MGYHGGKCVSAALFLFLVILLAGGTIYWKPPKPLALKQDKQVVLPYRTVVGSTGKNVFPYILYKRESDNDHYWQYSAVIKSINPRQDDYKTYCRTVIADIIKSTGTDRVAVNVYDDMEAYKLSEVKGGQEYKALTQQEMDSVTKHTIATYTGDIYGDEGAHRLTFCTSVDSGYASRETYIPLP